MLSTTLKFLLWKLLVETMTVKWGRYRGGGFSFRKWIFVYSFAHIGCVFQLLRKGLAVTSKDLHMDICNVMCNRQSPLVQARLFVLVYHVSHLAILALRKVPLPCKDHNDCCFTDECCFTTKIPNCFGATCTYLYVCTMQDLFQNFIQEGEGGQTPNGKLQG